MKIYLTSPFSDKQVKIGGGLKTPEHVKSGGFRYDIVPTGDKLARAMFDQDFIKFDPTQGSYAVYRLTGTNLYVFYVHVENVTKSHIAKGTSFATVQAGKFLHVHIKDGSYLVANNKYIDWMEYVDPLNTITVIPGVDASYIEKKGKKAILDIPDTDPTEALKAEIIGLKNEVTNLKVEKAALEAKIVKLENDRAKIHELSKP